MEEKSPEVHFTVHLLDGTVLQGAKAPLTEVYSFYEYIAEDVGQLKFPTDGGLLALVACKRINYILIELPKAA